MELVLLTVLRRVRLGLWTFEPKDDTYGALRRFQAIAKALLHAKAIGYIEDVLPLVDCRGGAHYYRTVLVKGGLTYAGEEALAEEIGRDDLLQEMVDEMVQMDPRGILKEHWERAIARSRHDARGAITAANSFLEAVLKWIVSQRGHVPPENRKKLFEMAVAEIVQGGDHTRLDAITDHVDTLLRELGALRSKIGDAHGASGAAPSPTPALAMLSINVAATLALYLLDAYEEHDDPT